MKAITLKWELAGIIFIIILGGLLHFVFDWSGQWRPLALIAAVNESVWEHLKLGFWPALVYALVEYRYFGRLASNFLVAKTVGICLIPITIVVLFYSYTAVMEDTLVADLLIFVLAVVIGQLTAYRLLLLQPFPGRYHILALVAMVCLIAAFGLLTFYPPRLPLFRDPVGGGYGIAEENQIKQPDLDRIRRSWSR